MNDVSHVQGMLVPELSDRIGAWLHTQLNRSRASGRIWLALSGGLDSTVLLHCLCQQPALKSRLMLVHVHHGLSMNADAWQQHCRQLAQHYRVPIVCQAVTIREQGDGIEAAARQARYAVFAQQVNAGEVLLTAHHADDQIETFLQRWVRGAGLQGLGAMRAHRPLTTAERGDSAIPSAQLLRPLLPYTRTHLEQYAQQHGLTWIHDESNDDSRWTRNWWRHELLPRIWSRYPHQKQAALRSIEQLQQDQDVLAHLLKPYLTQCLLPVSWPNTAAWALDIDALLAIDTLLQPYILRAWWRQLKLPALSQQALHQWLQQLQANRDRQPQWPLATGVLQRHQQACYWHQPLTHMPTERALTPQTSIAWAGGVVRCQNEVAVPEGEYRLVAAQSVHARSLRPFQRPTKTFKQLFQEHGVPAWLRASWPVIINAAGDVVCVIGLAVEQDAQQRHPLAWQWRWES